MDPQEQQELLTELKDGLAALLTAVDGVAEDDAHRHPTPGRWSVLDCVEHCVLVEDYLLEQIRKAADAPEPMVNTRREELIRTTAPTRRRRVQAPEPAVPTGRFATLTDAVTAFRASREATVQFLLNCPDNLRAKLTTHPILGPINSHEALLLSIAHPHRHAGQIEEIRAALTAG